ncbi:hypothetical protein Pcinc_028266 [Petrolisthes cinctipes]|uniref:Uncharacterized protein n=1 Tax=Petrolisthes cinctipes TaxID=88211 RepID=A0AAE1F3D6_PETCI|nr:hypothetical protein Pcinc_028266 [Petrolisthes cinctipes]
MDSDKEATPGQSKHGTSTPASTLNLHTCLHSYPPHLPPLLASTPASTPASTLTLHTCLHSNPPHLPPLLPSTPASTLTLHTYHHSYPPHLPPLLPSTPASTLTLHTYHHSYPPHLPPLLPSTPASTLTLHTYHHSNPPHLPPLLYPPYLIPSQHSTLPYTLILYSCSFLTLHNIISSPPFTLSCTHQYYSLHTLVSDTLNNPSFPTATATQHREKLQLG